MGAGQNYRGAIASGTGDAIYLAAVKLSLSRHGSYAKIPCYAKVILDMHQTHI